MNKKLFALIATIAALASTSARADSFYFGFSNHHVPQQVYVAPRHYEPVYIPAPRVVYYAPHPVVISYAPAPHWKGHKKWHRHEDRGGRHRGYYRGYDDDNDYGDDHHGHGR